MIHRNHDKIKGTSQYLTGFFVGFLGYLDMLSTIKKPESWAPDKVHIFNTYIHF
jgi:hypothetical protein